MDMQNVSNLQIPEGAVRTIHDKDSRLIWGRLAYDTKYAGDTTQNGTPTPDTPVSINVVTGEQTVKLTGKNMAQTTDCNISGTNYSMSISKGSVELRSQATNVCFDLNVGTRLGAWMPNYASAPDHHLTGNGGTYIVSFHDTSTSGLNSNTIVGVFTNKRNNSITINNTLPLRNISISLDSDEYVKSILYWIGSGTTDCTIKFKVQLEQGSTSSTYESYQSKACQLSLGSAEFCRIGNYQDHIYKSGDDWYVHKATWSYTFDGSSDELWLRSGQSTSTNFVAGMANLQNFAMIGGNSDSCYCNYFEAATTLADNKVILSGYQSGGFRFLLYRFPSTSTVTDLTSFTTWLGNNHLKMVLVLSTPTENQITDTTLIGQLNAVHEWLTRYGYNATVIGNLPIIIDRTNI